MSNEPSPDDVFVIAEHIPHWVKNALDSSHSAILAVPDAKIAYKRTREALRYEGGDMKFTKLLRRSELLDWAEKHNHRLLMSVEVPPETENGKWSWSRRP